MKHLLLVLGLITSSLTLAIEPSITVPWEEFNVLFLIALLRGKPGRVTATPQENALIKFEEAVTSFCVC